MKGKQIKYLAFVALTFLLFSCAKHQLSTWHLTESEKLLAKNKLLVVDNKNIDKEELSSYIRQKPNRSILFGSWKFGLQWKNLWYNGKSGKKRPAVILDSSLVDRSIKQMGIFMRNEGYYEAKVSAETKPVLFLGVKKWETKKSKVIYTIDPGLPLTIDSTGNSINQIEIQKLVKQIKHNSLIKEGEILRIENLEEERARITEHLNNNGFYNFAENYIRFNVDSSRGKDSTIVITKIKQPSANRDHEKFYLNHIYINTTYDPYNGNNTTTDTLIYQGVNIISKGPSKFNPDPLYRSLFLHSGELFSAKKQSLTFRQFANLQMFSFIKIEFKEVNDSSGENLLDAYILLQPSKRMSFSTELMGTYREGFGANGQISFTRKNTFGNAEILNLSISGLIENQKVIEENDFKFGSNIGPRLSLTFPRLFLLPKLTHNIRQNAFPKTTLSAYYNFQQRSQIARHLTNVSLTYTWNEGKYKQHELSIPDISISDSKILNLSSLTAQEKFKFEDAISAGLKYGFTYNNQSNEKVKHPIYFTGKGWLIGPSALLADALNIEARNSETNAITLGGIRFATFFKFQGDLRSYYNMRNRQQVVLRSFIGAGIPLDKDGVIPFDQLYFGGGANSIRGWRQRTLGPGSYYDPDDNIDKLGEVKIEFNAEYRFPITAILKGALFVDAGNIWTETSENTGQNFEFNRFYNEFAISPGLGLRLDFDFFLFRLDLGVPVKQPYEDNKLKLQGKETQFNFGVGYPF